MDMTDRPKPEHSAKLDQTLRDTLIAHMAGMGLPSVGGEFEQAVLERAGAEVSGSVADSSSATPSSSHQRLLSAVSLGFHTVFSQLSTPQQQALRAGFDPFNAAVMQALNSPGGLASLLAAKGAGPAEMVQADPRSGRRFGPLRDDDARVGGRGGAESGGEFSAASLLKSTGLSQGVFNDLMQRFALHEIRQAAGFAAELGVSADAYTAKFAGLDKDSRADLRGFVGEMRDEPALSDDEKRKQIGAFRASHPKLRGLSDADLLAIVNAKQRDVRHEVGDDAKRTMRTGELYPATATADAVSAGVAKNAKARTAAAEASGSDVAANLDDAFGVGAQATKAVSVANAKPAGNTGRQPGI